MKRLSKRERILITGALIISSVALFLYCFYFPIKDESAKLKQKSEELTTLIDEGKTSKALVDNLKAGMKKLKTQTTESNGYLMDSIDEPDILFYISNSIADRSKKQTINYNETTDLEVYYSKDINLSFRTSYDELLKVLKAFEEGDKYTTINSIVIKLDEKTETTYAEGEDGEIIEVEAEKDSMPLVVDYSLRFYGKEATWDGNGIYDFIADGSYKKTNIFE